MTTTREPRAANARIGRGLRSRPPSAPSARAGTFRADIEGLRAVAVVLVVLAHAGVTGFAGGYVGVDVFFVISGFLITSLLLRELASAGRISIRRFYARRAMRLLPAATLVLTATLLGSWRWLTPLRTGEFAGDAVAAAFSSINIRLALAGTDYLAADATPSPFQHFWSLAVEEQFYLVWPLLILAVCVLQRRAGLHRGRLALTGVLVALTVVSFTLSVWQTAASAPWAYFGAHTRAWELGAGALLAIAGARLRRLPIAVAALLGWAGLAAVLYAAVAFDDATAFPGAAAAVPVLGAAALIAAGADAPRHGVPALLSVGPMQLLGRLSYGWYLWHWPLLMIAPAALGVTPSAALNLLLCAAALGLAWVTFRFVECPMRERAALRARPGRAIALGLVLCTTVAGVAVAAGAAPHQVPVGDRTADLPAAVAGSADPAKTLAGFIRRAGSAKTLPANLTPALATAGYDTPQVNPDGCHVAADVTSTPGECVYGDPVSETTVVLFGDSHAAQWFPALQHLAEQHHWRLVSLTKSACTAADVAIIHESLKRSYTECRTWHRDTLSRIDRLRPQLVVVATSFAYRLVDTHTDVATQWRAGWERTLGDLHASGANVALITDTPYLRGRVPACLSQFPHDIGRCGRPLRTALYGPEQRRIVGGYAGVDGVTVINPVPWMCSTVCPPVLGNVVVYRDSNHLTTVFSRTLAPLLDARLPVTAPR